MNSNEFVKYIVNLKYHSYRQVCSTLANFLVIEGRGDYGTAFKLSDGRIAKIYKSHDAAYQSFLDMAYMSKSIHLPTIHCNVVFAHFGFVIVEFIDVTSLKKYVKDLRELTNGMTNIILSKQEESSIPESLEELAEEMKYAAQGFCLDFREPNFGVNNGILKIFDPFTLRTKHNFHLVYVEVAKKLLKRSNRRTL